MSRGSGAASAITVSNSGSGSGTTSAKPCNAYSGPTPRRVAWAV